MFAEVVASAFGRGEPRLRARSYLLGVTSGLEQANGWTLAEFAGDATPLADEAIERAWAELVALQSISLANALIASGLTSPTDSDTGTTRASDQTGQPVGCPQPRRTPQLSRDRTAHLPPAQVRLQATWPPEWPPGSVRLFEFCF